MADEEVVQQPVQPDPNQPPLPLEPEKPEQPEPPETPAEGQPEAKAPETPEQPKPERKVPKWAEERFGELTRQREEAKREAEALRKEAALYKAMAEGKEQPEGQPKPGSIPTADELQRLVRAEAARLAQAEAQQKKAASFFETGRKEYADFNDRCSLIDSLGALERPEFVQIVTGMDDGAKVVAALADQPEEASRILTLPPLVMAQELAKMSIKLASPKSPNISGAPKPIRPIDGAAKAAEDLSDELSDAEWFRRRAKQVQATKGPRS